MHSFFFFQNLNIEQEQNKTKKLTKRGDINKIEGRSINPVPHNPVFPLTFQLGGFVPLTSEKWGYKKQNRGTKRTTSITQKKILFPKFRSSQG